MGSQITVAALYEVAEGYRLITRDINRLRWQKENAEGRGDASKEESQAHMRDYMKG